MHPSDNDRITFQFTERLSQHLLRYLGDLATKLVETKGAWSEIVEDEWLPAPSHNSNGMGNGAVLRV